MRQIARQKSERRLIVRAVRANFGVTVRRWPKNKRWPDDSNAAAKTNAWKNEADSLASGGRKDI
jgi:hypothetical protein